MLHIRFLLSAICFLFSAIRSMSARKKRRNPRILFGIIALTTLLITGMSIFVIYPSYPSRIGVAVVGEPTIVFSFDPVRKSVTAMSIPSDTYVDVTRGYGAYPISSVWKLDSIDKRHGTVYTETLEEALGIPVGYFIDSSDKKGGFGEALTQIQSSLSIPSCIRALIQKKRTNIPPGLLFKLSSVFRSISPTDMTLFDLENQSVFEDTILPDGTSVKKIDTGKLALLLGTHTEDAQIRKENLRIAVYNTTNSPGLAQKVARVMEQTGFHVVTIANDDQFRPTTCIVRGKREVHETNTVKTLLWLYGCLFEEENMESQSDVTLIIGTDFGKRFLPF